MLIYPQINIEHCICGGSEFMQDGLEHSKTIPETIVAQCLHGRYEVWAHDQHAIIEAGDYFSIAPMQNIRIIHHHDKDQRMAARWLHLKTRTPAFSDFLQDYILPLHIRAKESPQFNKHFQTLQQLSQMQSIELINNLHYQQHSFAVAAYLLESSTLLNEPINHQALSSVYAYVENNLQHNIQVADLAACMHLSAARFYVVFKNITGSSPKAWLQNIRLERAAHFLLNTQDTLGAIANRCGFANAFHFSRLFKQWSGTAPKPWRNEHQQRTV
ncbi:MAG: helix-turn-helix transcriptional regulator [Planctomycetes bacterium]|nr:helix-turn-helix transcriptional regulator [Planctomycetota bacterium]